MAYFNGGLHGWNDPILGYIPPEPITCIYCDDCAKASIPLPETTRANSGREHWDTGFRWTPVFGGQTPCHECGKFC